MTLELPTIRLGTRRSQLALAQSGTIKTRLENLGARVETVEIETTGDNDMSSLAQIGGQGLFTKQLQIALLKQQIDLAVHSLKDLPTADHPQLMVAAIPFREDRCDALITNNGQGLQELPAGAVVGTGSVRRTAQLLKIRPDLTLRDIRGNVDTRIAKLKQGQYDAIVLAVAGLKRLGLEHHVSHVFSTTEMLPAVGQGALGLEIRRDDDRTGKWVEQLNDPASFFAAISERAMLQKLYAGCLSPVGADSTINDDKIVLTGIVLARDGSQAISASETARLTDNPLQLGQAVADKLLEQGAARLISRA